MSDMKWLTMHTPVMWTSLACLSDRQIKNTPVACKGWSVKLHTAPISLTATKYLGGRSIPSYLLIWFFTQTLSFHFLCAALWEYACEAPRCSLGGKEGGLSNLNTQWHGPNWRINGGEEGLNQQPRESTAWTGEYNLCSPDPWAFTPARTNTHCYHQLCERGRKNGDWKMETQEWDSPATTAYWLKVSFLGKTEGVC